MAKGHVMLNTISPTEAANRFKNGEIRLIDIREPDEFIETHIDGSRLVPLSIIDMEPLLDEGAPKLPVAFFCRSGRRAREAVDKLEKAASRAGVSAMLMDEGLNGWVQASLPVIKNDVPISLFRQVQIGAGSLVLLGTLGALVWKPFLALAIFVGAGLVFAGASGFCGLGILLGKMPWNKK